MSNLDILFVHNNFPAQFRNVAEQYSRQSGVRVKAICSRRAGSLANVDVIRYNVTSAVSAQVHPFARRFDQECRRAEQIIYAANSLKLQGFDPKLIFVHPGWGESQPLKSLFPRAKIIVYAEFYYRPHGTDVGFDREFGQFGVDGDTRVSLRNASSLLALADADLAIAPTHWQRSVFPQEFQSKIHVIHDGIDTDALQPRRASTGSQDEEIVTFVARNLEPYRGFHSFMRALPAVLRARPMAQIHIVGGNGVSYGNPPIGFENWREAMLSELGAAIDLSRVHFRGKLNYGAYVSLLRRSRAHVYLTYPFVLSWSMLEAMSLGCHIIGSDTPPVTEVIQDGFNGSLVPFENPATIAGRIIETLAQPVARYVRLREAARQTIIDRYDLKRVVLPAQRKLFARYLPDTVEKPLPETKPSRQHLHDVVLNLKELHV